MGRLPAVFALALACTAAARAAGPTLTLKAPGATRFDHRIEFVGRLSPSVPGARIRLLRAGELIAVGVLRRDGTFRIPVRIARPGPFRVSWSSVFSHAVTVRIHPLLETSLVGPRVVGAPLTLVAHLRPQDAGTVRVRVVRSGRQTLVRVFHGSARVSLPTSFNTYRVRVESVPRPGYAPESRELGVTLRPPMLRLGFAGAAISELAHRLAALHYAIPVAPKAFDADILQSVYAFQKVQGLPRTGIVDTAFWRRLERPLAPSPRYAAPADHIEIDKARQALFVVRGGRISLIVPVSTAGIPGYFTPVGRFAIYRKVRGYDPSPLGILYDPMYFTGGYAIHGNPSVPPFPASHGCVRVPNFVIVRLFVTEPYGETVYVY